MPEPRPSPLVAETHQPTTTLPRIDRRTCPHRRLDLWSGGFGRRRELWDRRRFELSRSGGSCVRPRLRDGTFAETRRLTEPGQLRRRPPRRVERQMGLGIPSLVPSKQKSAGDFQRSPLNKNTSYFRCLLRIPITPRTDAPPAKGHSASVAPAARCPQLTLEALSKAARLGIIKRPCSNHANPSSRRRLSMRLTWTRLRPSASASTSCLIGRG